MTKDELVRQAWNLSVENEDHVKPTGKAMDALRSIAPYVVTEDVGVCLDGEKGFELLIDTTVDDVRKRLSIGILHDGTFDVWRGVVAGECKSVECDRYTIDNFIDDVKWLKGGSG